MSSVQIQKTLFLSGQETSDLIEAEFYSFEPCDYGPFDRTIHDDLRRMMSEDHVTQE